jgi:hypothetical protein
VVDPPPHTHNGLYDSPTPLDHASFFLVPGHVIEDMVWIDSTVAGSFNFYYSWYYMFHDLFIRIFWVRVYKICEFKLVSSLGIQPFVLVF